MNQDPQEPRFHAPASDPALSAIDFGRGFSCEFCNKRFRTAKAMGGHMRIHYELRSKKSSTAVHGGNNEPLCPSCGKEFSSLKAMYGHMRSHPERPWRGIRPPFPVSNPTDSLPSWSVTAKRGRNRSVEDEELNCRKVMKLSNLEKSRDRLEIRVSAKKYECDICCKEFSTHQALGGHKSSHNKLKKKEIESSETDQGLARILNVTIISCKGGVSVGTAEAQSSNVTSTEESSHTGWRLLNIDLNELPPMEEGEGIESCFFYQSSPKS